MQVIALCLALVAIGTAVAEAEDGQVLSLRTAIVLAQRQNPAIVAAQDRAEAARAAAGGAAALANPEIIVAPTVAGAGGSDAAVIVAQRLEVGGQRTARARLAAGEADATRAEAAVVERAVIRDVTQAYWDMALAQAVAELRHANENASQAFHAAALRQVELGATPGAHAMKAGVELGRATQERLAADAELAEARALLNTLMGQPPRTVLDLSDGLHFSPLEVDEQTLWETAVTSRPEITAARAALFSRRAEIDAAAALYRPDLAVQFRRESFDGEAGVGVSFILPLIDWGSVRHERRRAEEAAAAQERHLAVVENQLKLEIESAVLEVRLTEEQLHLYEQDLVAVSERLAEMAEKGYRVGATGYLDVLESQRTLRTVRLEYYATLAAHLRAKAQLEWATGRDLTEIQRGKR